MSGKRFRIAHCADLHLGSSFNTLPQDEAEYLKDAQLLTLRQLCEDMAQKRIDFLFMAGDVFDQAQPHPELVAQVKRSFSLCPQTKVVISPGNHDPLLPKSAWCQTEWLPNVYLIQGEDEYLDFTPQGLRVYGAAFRSRSASETLLPANLPTLDPEYCNILLIHGDLIPAGQKSNYNPLYLTQLSRSSFDYLALGHIHQRSELQQIPQGPYWLYPGCLMGRNFAELGVQGYYWGEIGKNSELSRSASCELEMHFAPLNVARFQRITLHLSPRKLVSPQDLLPLAEQAIQTYLQKEAPAQRHYLQLVFTGNTGFALDCDYLRRKLARRAVYLTFQDKTRPAIELSKLAEEQSLRGLAANFVLELERRDISTAWPQWWSGFKEVAIADRPELLQSALALLLEVAEA